MTSRTGRSCGLYCPICGADDAGGCTRTGGGCTRSVGGWNSVLVAIITKTALSSTASQGVVGLVESRYNIVTSLLTAH